MEHSRPRRLSSGRFAAALHLRHTPELQWVEAMSSFQIPGLQVVGLADREVGEAAERVRAAIESIGEDFPKRRIVLNLSPAHLRKGGTGADLAMALAILEAHAQKSRRAARGPWAAWGELGLDGAVKGLGRATRSLWAAWEAGCEAMVFAGSDSELFAHAAALIADARVQSLEGKPMPTLLPVTSLREAWALYCSETLHSPLKPTRTLSRPDARERPVLMPLLHGLRRVVGTAAAGRHHLLLMGPKGSGKSHALDWLAAVLPQSSARERLERTLLAELSESVPETTVELPPFRRVSANVRPSALIGSVRGTRAVPGEFSLAHGGILVADEFPEWASDSRETLREPLERRRVCVTRTGFSGELPAGFLFVATGNYCPCGGWPREIPTPAHLQVEEAPPPPCRCTVAIRGRYFKRLSGPILDRIDLFAHVFTQPPQETSPARSAAFLSALRDEVERTSDALVSRWGSAPGAIDSGRLETEIPRRVLELIPATPSLRSRHKLLRVALTLAAWDGLDLPRESHFDEARLFRPESQALIQAYLLTN